MAADENRCRQRPVSGTGFFGGGERVGGSGPAQRSVRSVVVVEVAELVEQCVEFVEGGRSGVGAQPFLQRLPEPFDLAAGLRMTRGGVDGVYPRARRLASKADSKPCSRPV